jgi:hypothetical protein
MAPEIPMIRTQVQLTEAQMRELKRVAKNEDVSVAELVRRGVDLYLRQCEGPSEDELWERSFKAIGRFSDREGATDVAENHDRYLDEIYGEH